MRALAQFVSRGRTQALLVAVISAGIPLLFWASAAVIGLVTLRQGISEGLIILLWTLLPAGVMAWFGEIVPLATIVSTLLLAGLLRASASWQLVLLVGAALGLAFSLALITVGHGYVAEIEALLAQMIEGLARPPQAGVAPLEAPPAATIAGLFGLGHVITAVCCLLLARWWQAMLDNPGGLKREFHALRIEHWPTLVLLSTSALLLFALDGFRVWALVALLPLLFAGLALIHGLVALRGLGTQWLVLTYIGLVLLPPVMQGLIVLAAADSWMDFRRRAQAGS